MNRLKLLRLLLALFIVLTVLFGVGLLLPDMKVDVLGRICLWCGFISHLLLAVGMYSELRRTKKGLDK